MSFDAKRLGRLDWAVLGSGGIALIALFLPWYGVSIAGFSASVSGWSTGYGWLGAVLLVAGAAWFLLWRMEVDLPKVRFTPLVVTTGASAVGLALVIVRWITLPRASGGVLGRSFNYGPRVGIWLTLVVGVIQVACAVVLFRQSGETLPWRASGGTALQP